MARIKVNRGGIRAMLGSAGVRDDMTRRAERIAAAARSSAPVRSGEYRDSIRVEQATTGGYRAVARVVSDVPYAGVVEADTGNLARALDAAR